MGRVPGSRGLACQWTYLRRAGWAGRHLCGRRAQCCISTGQGCHQGSAEAATRFWSRQALEKTSELLVYALEVNLSREPSERNFRLWISRMLEIHNAFYTENSYKQHLWSKMGTEGHPNRMQLDAWELRAYLVPHGQKPYPLWDQATDKIKYVDPASSGDGVLHRAQAGGGGCVKLIEKQLQKMRKRLLEGPKPKNKEGEGGEEEAPESDGTVSGLSVQSDYNVYRDLVDVSDEEAVREKTSKRLAPTSKAKAIEKSKESKAKKEKDPRPPLPRRKEEKEEKKEDERPPLERKVPAKGKGKSSAASARPASYQRVSLSRLELKDMRVMIQKNSHLQSLCRQGHQRVSGQMMWLDSHQGQLQCSPRILFSRGWRRLNNWRMLMRCWQTTTRQRSIWRRPLTIWRRRLKISRLRKRRVSQLNEESILPGRRVIRKQLEGEWLTSRRSNEGATIPGRTSRWELDKTRSYRRLWCQWFYVASWSFARASDWRGHRIQRVFHGLCQTWVQSCNGIPVWTCHDHFEAIAVSWKVDIYGPQSWDESRWKRLDYSEGWWKDCNLFAQWCLETPSVDLGLFSNPTPFHATSLLPSHLFSIRYHSTEPRNVSSLPAMFRALVDLILLKVIHVHHSVFATIHIHASFCVAAHIQFADHPTTVLEHLETSFLSTDLQPWLYSSRES